MNAVGSAATDWLTFGDLKPPLGEIVFKLFFTVKCGGAQYYGNRVTMFL